MFAKSRCALASRVGYGIVEQNVGADCPGERRLMNAEIKSQKDQHPFLRSLSPEHQAIVLHNAKQKDFATGELILKQGEPANCFYLIESGRVAVEAGAQSGKNVQTIGPGEALGWSWLFPPFSWHFSARAMEPTKCVVLDGGHLLVIAEEDPKFGYDLMRRISQMLVTRLQATRKKLLETSGQ